MGVASLGYPHICSLFLRRVELSIICRRQESDKEMMMKRRDLLRRLGGVGAMTAMGRLLNPATAGAQSFPAPSDRSAANNLASRLAASIQKHKVPGASAAVFRAGQWEIAAAGVTNVRAVLVEKMSNRGAAVVAAVLVLTVATLVAYYVPARRATRIAALAALRTE